MITRISFILALGFIMASCGDAELQESNRWGRAYNACKYAVSGNNAIPELKDKLSDMPMYCAEVANLSLYPKCDLGGKQATKNLNELKKTLGIET